MAPAGAQYGSWQSVHVDDDALAAYLPATQAAHEDSEDAPAVVEYLPATQAVHVDSEDAPSVGEYLPAQTVTKENRRVSGIVYADIPPQRLGMSDACK